MGIESEAGRWRDLPRTARLGERQPENEATHEGSRPADSRRSRRTPTPTCSGLWRDYERDFLATGQTQTNRNKTKDFQKRKTKRGEWAPLTV